MIMDQSNVVLIGMPSSGKTTTGKILAEITGKAFVDTDSIIKERACMPLKEIVERQGLEAFLSIQEKSILNTEFHNNVIATGGGVVHCEEAMKYLKNEAYVVYLRENFEEIIKRITPGRRFARKEGQSLRELYDERVPLYEKYADIIVECGGREAHTIAQEIAQRLKEVM